ncbi:hypothetical protein Hanom_Chr14g01263011 [Helianthus anomalus]
MLMAPVWRFCFRQRHWRQTPLTATIQIWFELASAWFDSRAGFETEFGSAGQQVWVSKQVSSVRVLLGSDVVRVVLERPGSSFLSVQDFGSDRLGQTDSTQLTRSTQSTLSANDTESFG